MAKFQKGISGNPNGRAKGSRNRATMLFEQIFDEKLFGVDRKADAIISKVIEQAVNGDTACIRLCFDRLAPSRKDRPVYFELPKMQEAKDAVNASAAIVAAVAGGDLTPEDAKHFLGWLTVSAVRHQFRIAQDGVERSAQLVAHVGENCDLCWLASSSCRLLSWISSNKRTFSIAIEAWSAKVARSSTCFWVKDRTSLRVKTRRPIGVPSRRSGTPSIVRKLNRRAASTS